MKNFTNQRTAQTTDEIWIVEHDPIYTLGQQADTRHILEMTDIPIYQTDRGGDVTYHGPGQSLFYFLFDLKRRDKLFVKTLVSLLEQITIKTLSHFQISSTVYQGAPGVYLMNRDGPLNGAKIAALGLKVKTNGCSYHGLALNVAMDLSPFRYINPCGLKGVASVDMKSVGFNGTQEDVEKTFIRYIEETLDEPVIWKEAVFS